MINFKLWLENEAQNDDEIKKNYNILVKALLGGNKDNLSLSIHDFKGEEGKNGAEAVLQTIDSTNILQKLDSSRVSKAKEWLENPSGDDSGDEPSDYTVGGLLKRLFGEDDFKHARNITGNEKIDKPPQMSPKDSKPQMPKATTAPMAQEMIPTDSPETGLPTPINNEKDLPSMPTTNNGKAFPPMPFKSQI